MGCKKGFISLRTLLISMAILVLVVICIISFRGYMQASYMLNANNTAQKAFDAAQAYLTKQKAAGKLEEFNTTAKYFGKALSMDLQERIIRENYKGADGDAVAERYRTRYREGDIRYIVMESETIAGENRSDNPLLKMFAYQIVDDNLLDDAFLMEYNCVTGKVLTVFYSKEAETFTYEGERNGMENVISRDQELLKTKKQGYLGVKLNEIL